MAISIKSYNPGFLADDELRAMFCVRTGEFESLLETLRENTGESNQHVVVVGPRGSGKTTLLLRVALEVRSDPQLSFRLYPIVFAEESYTVGTCGEFWLECLSRLAQQQEPPRPGELDLRRTVEDVRKEQDDRVLRERCLGALLDFAEREDKRLVLHVENLNMLFSDMMDPDAEWCLRKTLQTEPRIMIIGSATSRFGEIDRPDRALYDLFRVLTLQPLDREESAVLCETVSGRTLDDRVVRRLQILTGGSPRLLAIMARFGAARSFRTLLSDLLDLVDEHTAYFKSHLESLPPQERRVYLALAELWKPATAREVGERARMATSKCSAQLRRLAGRGVVSDEGGTHRRKQYYVSERLYNIYYLLRRSRGMNSLVGALVQFMDAYYSQSELRGIVDDMVAELGAVDARTRVIYQAAFEQFSSIPELAWRFYREYPDHVPQDVRAVTEEAATLLKQGGELLENGDLRGALAVLEGLLDKYRRHTTPTVQYPVLTALVNKGVILVQLHRDEEAMVSYDEAAELFMASTSPELRPVAATALLNKSYLLKRLGRTKDAIDACDQLIERIPGDGSDRVAELVAAALISRADMLNGMGRAEDALAAYDELQNRFGHTDVLDVLVVVASAQVNKATIHFNLKQWDEALKVCEEVSARFGNHASPRVLQQAWRAVAIVSMVLGLQGRTTEQLKACEQLLDRLDRHRERALAGEVADYDADGVLTLRLVTYGIRVLAYIKNGDTAVVTADVREILQTVPLLSAVPAGTIETLMVASIALGVDRTASLIRESPSADHLLPLTTALDWQMGRKPRVATEVSKVAEDIQRQLADIQEYLQEVEES